MFYVVMTDTFLSGWGEAENKISKYVIECETREEAEIVAENAKHRSDMKHISIKSELPKFYPKAHHVSKVNKEQARNWFIPNYFKTEK